MYTLSEERVVFSQVSPVHTTGKNAESPLLGATCAEVEVWMTEVENQMLAAIREAVLKLSLNLIP